MGEPPSMAAQTDDLRRSLRRLERQDWWLWSTTIIVMLLLVAALFALSVPAIRFPALWRAGAEEGAGLDVDLDVAIHALLGLVLLFSVFVVYQQLMIKRLRHSLAGQLSTIATLQTRAELYEKLAIVDPLTELYNRRFATEHLPLELARAERFSYPITALLLDLNGFKAINDEHGHAAGDLALSEFARNLRRCFRSSDLPVRMGGDEFLVLLPECPAENVPLALTHLRNVAIEFEGKRIPVSFSAGWSQHEHGESAEALLARADQALYLDKRTASAERQRRQAEAMMLQAQKLQTMGQLAGGVTHDFNNIITIIRGYSTLLLEQMPVGDPLRPKVEQMDRAAHRAAQLTRQLMNIARGRTLDPHQSVDLNRVVHDLEPILKAVLGRRIELRLEVPQTPGVTRADPSQLQQIILNVVVNARDAMPEGGRLSIRTAEVQLDDNFAATHPGSRPGAYIALEFHDTGQGIPQDVRDHIFEPFFTTKEHRGTGLGLSIVYGTVKQLGGYIWVDSEVGSGNRFAVYLPLIAVASYPKLQPAKAAAVALGR